MLEARIEFEISNTDDIFRVSSQYNERSAVAYHADLIKAMNTVWKSL